MIWLWIGLAVVVGVPVVLGGLQLLALGSAKVRRLEDAKSELPIGQASREIGSAFLDRSGFRFVGAYEVSTLLGTPVAVMWQHGDEATYLAVLLVGESVNTDIVSILSWERGIGVTTSTARDGHTVPKPPTAWLQSFSGRTTAVLWDKHQQAEAALADHYGVMPEAVTLDPGDVLEQSVRRDAKHVLSHPWLLLAVAWRFWIGRFLLHNKPVTARLPRRRASAV